MRTWGKHLWGSVGWGGGGNMQRKTKNLAGEGGTVCLRRGVNPGNLGQTIQTSVAEGFASDH